MSHWKDENGFILLEVMVLSMVLLLTIMSVMTLILREHQRVVGRLEEQKMSYTVISALRLMADAMLSENEEITLVEDGLDKVCGTLIFHSDEMEICIPVTVWTECTEDTVILHAEAGRGSAETCISLTMKYEDGWYPIGYTVAGD